jgi:hypothetical protein
MGDDRRRRKNNDSTPTCPYFFYRSEYKTLKEGAQEDQCIDPHKLGFFILMKEDTKRMMPIMVPTSSTGSKKKEKQTDVSTSKQTYIGSGLKSYERALANIPTQELMRVIDFVEQTGMPVSAILSTEGPPRDSNFVPRYPFQLGKTLIRQERVYKLPPKMHNS